MNKGAIIFLVVVFFSSVSSIWLSTMDQLNAIEPQPPIPVVPDDFVEVQASHRELLIEKAINDPDVEEYLEEGYEIYKVYEYHDVINDFFIYDVLILTQMQKLPWVLGISLGVQVDFVQEGALVIKYYLTLANLTAYQKEQVMDIACDYVEENYGDDYIVLEDASVGSWQESRGGDFFSMLTQVFPLGCLQIGLNLGQSGQCILI